MKNMQRGWSAQIARAAAAMTVGIFVGGGYADNDVTASQSANGMTPASSDMRTTRSGANQDGFGRRRDIDQHVDNEYAPIGNQPSTTPNKDGVFDIVLVPVRDGATTTQTESTETDVVATMGSIVLGMLGLGGVATLLVARWRRGRWM